MEGLQRCDQDKLVRRLATSIALAAVLLLAVPCSRATSAGSSGGCNAQGCDFGTGADSGNPGASGTGSTGTASNGSGGPTTCTATDFTKQPPQKVTGPITSRPAFGA